ncbi:hypothetical protein ACFYM2_21205 [Streptomyces sp. NPDC006711]|uniref:hypothetical protein n=1 Tax=Streptomyces sp. NPDC006711 TaxID=3364762 RepID=UPI0036762345
MPTPIEPTRIIPSGVHIPIPVADAPPPPPPPPPPPWYSLPDPPPPAPLEVRVTVDLVQPVPEPEPSRDWSWLWAWLRPVQTIATAGIAALPLLPHGYSLIAAWAEVLHKCRTEESTGGAYTLACVALGVAFLLDRSRRWWARTLLVTAIVGATGAMSLFDPVTAVTGVTR